MTLSLSLSLCVCVHSLLSSCSLLFVFTFHPQKRGSLDTKKNSLPSPLSRVDKSILSSSAQIVIDCNQRTSRVLHQKVFTCFCRWSSSPNKGGDFKTAKRERADRGGLIKEDFSCEKRGKVVHTKKISIIKNTTRKKVFEGSGSFHESVDKHEQMRTGYRRTEFA